MFVNEYVEVTRNGKKVRLTVVPINYMEYSRLMSKPFKRPTKNQAWRLLDNSNGAKKAELIVGPIDTIIKYVTRYVKRPRAIILDVLSDGTSLDGYVGADGEGSPTANVSEAVQGILVSVTQFSTLKFYRGRLNLQKQHILVTLLRSLLLVRAHKPIWVL